MKKANLKPEKIIKNMPTSLSLSSSDKEVKIQTSFITK
jgi:hypothetical protein